jgi:hypothetical protein
LASSETFAAAVVLDAGFAYVADLDTGLATIVAADFDVVLVDVLEDVLLAGFDAGVGAG